MAASSEAAPGAACAAERDANPRLAVRAPAAQARRVFRERDMDKAGSFILELASDLAIRCLVHDGTWADDA